jgi:arsenate reductase (thioredoxin)
MLEQKKTILVLCTGNSCRSQMAEGFLRAFAGDSFDIYSAGFEPKDEIHPCAKQVMHEIGCDINGQHPKGADEYLGELAVTHLIVVCANAEEKCPRIFPGALNRWYWPFDDPAAATGTVEERLAVFRQVRDQIEQKIREWLPTVTSQM